MKKLESGLSNRFFVVICLLLTGLLLESQAMAAKYYVKPTGSDSNSGLSETLAWQHVMKACATVVAGDTVLIRSGTYDETSNLNGTAWGYPIQKGLVPNNSGTAGHPIVLKGYPGDTRPIIKGKSPSYGAPNTANYRMGVLLDNWSYLIYDSLEFRFGPTGFFLQGGNPHDIIVRNCVIDSMLGLGGAPLDDNSGGIVTYYEQGTRNCTFENNEIFACGAWSSGTHLANYRAYFNTGGMWLYTCDSCIIRNNVIHDVMNGIRFKEEARYTETYGNTFYNIAYAAMWAHSGQRFAYSGPDHVMSRWHNNIVYNAAICFNVGEGTGGGVQDDTLLYFYNNTCDCSNSAKWSDSGNGSVWGGVQGIEGGFGKAYFFNNIFYNVPAMYNPDATDHAGAFNLWSASNPIFRVYEDYNVVFGQGGSAKYFAINSGTYTLSEWKAASISQMVAGQGTNTRVVDPLFVNASAHNYNLQSGSPALSGGKGGSFSFFPGTSRAATVTLPTYLGALGTTGADSSIRIGVAPAVVEGGDLVFPVTLGTTFASSCTIRYSTVNGTAASPGDFTAASNAQLTIPAGSTTGSITVHTINDTAVELTETMTVTLSSTTIGTIASATATGTINDNDALPAGQLSRIAFEFLSNHSISVSGSYSGFTTTHLADTIVDPYGGAASTWASDENGTVPHWVTASFGQSLSVAGMTISWAWNSARSTWTASHQYQIQGWNGTAFYDLAAVTNGSADSTTKTTFAPRSTDRIRIYQPAGMGPSDYPAIMWMAGLKFWGPLDTIPPARTDSLK